MTETAQVDIWWCDLTAVDAAAAYAVLSPTEKDRYQGLIDPAKRAQFGLARSCLRRILSHYTDLPANTLRIDLEPSGKPILHPADNPNDLHFNLAHTGDWAVVAVANHVPLGVDAESIRELFHLSDLAAQVLNEADYRVFLKQPPAEQRQQFFSAWTEREAVQKMANTTPPPEYQLFPLDCPTGLVGHLAVQTTDAVTLIQHDFAALEKAKRRDQD